MIGFQIFSSTPTPFDLNGPVLSFTSEPSSKIVCNSGIATFIGIATATFPTQTPPNPAVGLVQFLIVGMKLALGHFQIVLELLVVEPQL